MKNKAIKGQSDTVRVRVSTFALMIGALILGAYEQGSAATTTATVEVNIVSTINLVAQNGIVFGDIAVSSISGTVTIGTDSSRVTTGGVTINTNTSGTPAFYEVSGDPNAFYSVTLPTTVTLTSPTLVAT